MIRSFQTYIDQLGCAANPQNLRDAMVAVAGRYDLHSFAYFAAHRDGRRPARLITNYPPDWEAHYQANRYENADPVIGRVRLAPDPFDWSADLAADEAASQFFCEASNFGIRYGRTFPIHDRTGWIAAVTFATDRPAHRRCIQNHTDALELIALYFHIHAQRAFALEDLNSGPRLTEREAECLYWASLGKSAPDIGEIIGLSESTVKFHLRNVRAKFRVSTTIQAAIAFDRARRRRDS